MELLIKKNVCASKPNFPVVFQKKKLKLCICVWTSMTWLRALESTLPFKTASRNSWETAQLSKMLCDNDPLVVQQFGHSIVLPKFPAALSFQQFGHSIVLPKFPAALSFLNLLEPPSLFGEYLTFFLWF